MATLFDIVSVASFIGLVVGFFLWTERDHRTLIHFVIAGIVLAVGNQVGNAGQAIFGSILIVVGISYAILVAWRPAS
jgi:hypothetical protein